MKRTQPPRTHCQYGHVLEEANLYIRKNGEQECRTCRRQRRKEYRARHKAAKRPGVKIVLVVPD